LQGLHDDFVSWVATWFPMKGVAGLVALMMVWWRRWLFEEGDECWLCDLSNLLEEEDDDVAVPS